MIEVYDPENRNGRISSDRQYDTQDLEKVELGMTPNVTREEVFRLARVMTWQNARSCRHTVWRR